MSDVDKPLGGVTVVELGHSVAAPYAGLILERDDFSSNRHPAPDAHAKALRNSRQVAAFPNLLAWPIRRS
ncbi:hypothetical protein [Bradyrhizobium sp.]|uniref:hypothetical protein n=1 Tax=Bradyrhizobium sp. TaxID=376 RepID=UPI003C746B77